MLFLKNLLKMTVILREITVKNGKNDSNRW